jgi:hypothetical protein
MYQTILWMYVFFKIIILMEPIQTHLMPWIIVLFKYKRCSRFYIVEKKSLILKYDLPCFKGL